MGRSPNEVNMIQIKAIEMRYRMVGNVAWVELVIIESDGSETIMCDTEVDADTIRVDIPSDKEMN